MNGIKLTWLFLILFAVIMLVSLEGMFAVINQKRIQLQQDIDYLKLFPADSAWIAPSLYTDRVTTGKERAMVIYGEELIAHTSRYFGPHGTIAQLTNGMNCQNCHLDAGTRPWGNNFGAVFSNYPQYRARSNTIQTISDRVKDCFERSLNGKSIDSNSYEMKCFYAYFKWLGRHVIKGKKPCGSGLPSIELIDRAADITKGKIIYKNECSACHGVDGSGVLNLSGNEYIYPPLWGQHSFNDGSGLYRLSRFAAFIQYNMPLNSSSHTTFILNTEAAWDVAAYVNSMPRPHLDQSKDWPDLSKKAFDVPFGPYADPYDEKQHKFGPYRQIIKPVQKIKLSGNNSL